MLQWSVQVRWNGACLCDECIGIWQWGGESHSWTSVQLQWWRPRSWLVIADICHRDLTNVISEVQHIPYCYLESIFLSDMKWDYPASEKKQNAWELILASTYICHELAVANTVMASFLVFTGLMPFLPPNQQRQSTEATQSTNQVHGILWRHDHVAFLIVQHSRCYKWTYIVDGCANVNDGNACWKTTAWYRAQRRLAARNCRWYELSIPRMNGQHCCLIANVKCVFASEI